MTTTKSNVSAAGPLRLWPGIIIVAALWAARLAAPAVVPGPLDELMVRAFSSLGGTLAIAIWWLLFSGASQRERWAIAGVMVAAASVPLVFGHESIGVFWLVMYALPVLCLALVLSTAAARGLAQRRGLMVGAILIAGLPWTGVRIAGINGAGIAEFHWRWEETPEQRLLDSAVDARPAAAPVTAAPAPDLPVEPGLDANAAEAAPAPRQRHRRPRSAGLASAVRTAMASSPEYGSEPIGSSRRLSRSGVGRSAPAGRRSPSPATSSTRRSSEGTTRSLPPTGSAPVSPCGCTRTRRASTRRTEAPARGDPDHRRRRCLQSRRHGHSECARRE